MSTGTLVAVLGALGAGGILIKLTEGIWAWITGKASRENDAWAQRDREAKARRVLEEYAATLRRQLQDHGVEPEKWPDYQTRP